MRTGPVLLGVLVLLLGGGSVSSSAGPVRPSPVASGPVASGPVPAPSAAVGYAPPTTATLVVVRAFDPPVGPYAAGHRGVDLDLAGAPTVRAAADGTVTFAGPVAGRGVVVIAHADGIRTEYEPVTATVRAGGQVTRGEPVGRVSGRHPGCAVATCLHWGARRGETYIDPLSLLRPLGPVRLLPWPRDG